LLVKKTLWLISVVIVLTSAVVLTQWQAPQLVERQAGDPAPALDTAQPAPGLPVSPLLIDADQSDSYYFQQGADPTFHQLGFHTVQLNVNDAPGLSLVSYGTDIEYLDGTLVWMRLFPLDRPLTPDLLADHMETLLAGHTQLTGYALATINAFIQEQEPPPPMHWGSSSLELFVGCDDSGAETREGLPNIANRTVTCMPSFIYE
jgi:hypothetical protein